MKYDIKFFTFKDNEDSSYFCMKIVQNVEYGSNLGDLITISKDCNCVEVYDGIDVDDEEVIEFVKENFNHYKAVLGFIRRTVY
jgi:hypothetical protein